MSLFKPRSLERGETLSRTFMTFKIGLKSLFFNFAHLEKELNTKIIASFKSFLKKDEFLYILDWQHSSYKIKINYLDADDYNRIIFKENGFLYEKNIHNFNANYYLPSIYPDGDYYIFITKDMKSGVFGHPLEQSICVFGEKMVKIILSNKPQLFKRVLRHS